MPTVSAAVEQKRDQESGSVISRTTAFLHCKLIGKIIKKNYKGKARSYPRQKWLLAPLEQQCGPDGACWRQEHCPHERMRLYNHVRIDRKRSVSGGFTTLRAQRASEPTDGNAQGNHKGKCRDLHHYQLRGQLHVAHEAGQELRNLKRPPLDAQLHVKWEKKFRKDCARKMIRTTVIVQIHTMTMPGMPSLTKDAHEYKHSSDQPPQVSVQSGAREGEKAKTFMRKLAKQEQLRHYTTLTFVNAAAPNV